MAATNYDLGRRIVVRGVTGSGKSTLTRALGDALGLKVIELDEIYWQQPNWQPLPHEEFQPRIRDALDAASEGWVVDGNYSIVTSIVLDRADSMVWLNLPFRVSFFRVVKRTLRRSLRKELLWGVQRERLREQLFSRNSLFLWSITHHKATGRRVRGLMVEYPHLRTYELKSAADVAAFLHSQRTLNRPASS